MAVDDKTLKTSIKALGRTGTSVRRALAARGITGQPEDVHCCAVAEYLKVEFPDESVSVDGTEVTVNGACAPATQAVKDFISQFDDRAFPELLAHDDDCTGPRWDAPDWGFGYRNVECSCGALYRDFYEYDKDKARRFYKAAVAAWNTQHPTTPIEV